MVGHTSITETLLERGAKVDRNTKFSDGSALKIATEKGHAGIAFVLLEAGADPALETGYEDKSTLVAAAVHGRIDILQMFSHCLQSSWYIWTDLH